MIPVLKISIALPRDLLRAVRDAVESGDYASTSEVVRDALRDWKVRRPPARPTQQPDLSKSRELDIELLCKRLKVARLALRGSSRKRKVDFAVEFAHADPARLSDRCAELRFHLSMLFRMSDVQLHLLGAVSDPQAWLAVYDANQVAAAFSGSETDSSSTS